MARDRVAPEPALSEVVRQRLAALLDDIPARRALEPVEPDDGVREARGPAAPSDVPAAAPVQPPPPIRWVRAAWEFSRSHLVAVGLVILTGCLWAGYNVLQARSTPVVPVAVPTAVVTASPTPTPSPIMVHVLGAVRAPGVVRLSEGARVQDAIAAAGGLTPDADPAELNLAAVLTDGTQLVIGDADAPRGELRGAGSSGGEGGGQVSLNSASQEELEALPGVGPVTANRIIAWREEHGRFSSVEELQEVDGIGPKTYAQLAGHVRV